ncbi:MAG TPA: hypothetical protein VMU54_10820 [Planctomycetota bacterium]|nr:hypothetical protein [Planctomycetota bacterium]
MGQRSVRCGCGAEFPIPELPPSQLHCPRCGDRISFGAPDGGPLKVREDIREPIRPLPPRRPYYPLILLGATGVLLAGGLVGTIVYFVRHERPANPLLSEGVRARRTRDEEPVISIREIPVLPEIPRSPPLQVDPSKIPPLLPEEPPELAVPIAKAQLLRVRANLSGLVLTVLSLTGRPEEALQVETGLAREEDEVRSLLAPLSERPEVRSMKDCYRPGDQLTGFGNLALDPLHPLLFAEAIRTWLAEAQAGALALATVVRDGRPLSFSMWFPEFAPDLTQRVLGAPKKTPPQRPAGS